MAPMKRARHAFSPPRPGKSSKTSPSTSKKPAKSQPTTSKSTKGNKSTPKNTHKTGTKRKSQLILDSASDDEEKSSTNDFNEEEEEGGEESENESENDNEPDLPNDESTSSPQGTEYMLAEISTTTDASSTPVFNTSLIHKLLAHHFSSPSTKMSSDARDLATTYFDVFVREAIIRCAFERKERDGKDAAKVDDGWLEVDDLECVAVQLCLDF